MQLPAWQETAYWTPFKLEEPLQEPPVAGGIGWGWGWGLGWGCGWGWGLGAAAPKVQQPAVTPAWVALTLQTGLAAWQVITSTPPFLHEQLPFWQSI